MNDLLTVYEREYATTNITKSQIIEKYNLTEKQVARWTKGTRINSALPPEVEKTFSSDTILDDINYINGKAISFIKEQMASPENLELKDIKGMLDITKNIEDSIKGKNNSGTTVNVLVQNLTDRFKDDV